MNGASWRQLQEQEEWRQFIEAHELNHNLKETEQQNGNQESGTEESKTTVGYSGPERRRQNI